MPEFRKKPVVVEARQFTDIVERLRLYAEDAADLGATDEAMIVSQAAAEIERLRLGYTTLNSEVCQYLGKALGYPWFKDDQENFPGATEDSGVCTGAHVAETIAAEAARRIGNLEAERDRAFDTRNLALKEMSAAARQAGSWQGIAEGKDVVIRQLEAERNRLRSGFLMAMQYDNKCRQTGQPCDAPKLCACFLETEGWCDAPKEAGQ
jgi:hypothetical protein